MEKNTPYWKIYTDTGGTFTDCIAETPEGEILRRKVLSSSAIRGIAEVDPSQSNVKINMDEIFPDDFFRGYRFLFLSRPDQVFTIESYISSSSSVTLKGKFDRIPAGEHPFEIQSPEEAPVFAARLITKTRIGESFPLLNMRLSTTKGTNALLERRGGKTLFLITEGFKDLLQIRNQQRPDLFSLNIIKPKPFYHTILEVPARIDAKGRVIKKPDWNLLKERINEAGDRFEAAAVCLMHSYLNPEHERRVKEIVKQAGIQRVSCSSELSSFIKIVPRAVTADVNAYLSPVMEHYIDRISGVLDKESLLIMTSAGGLSRAENYTPKDGLLSGPAGGVIGAAAVAKRAFTGKDPADFSQQVSQHLMDKEGSTTKNPQNLKEDTSTKDPADLPEKESKHIKGMDGSTTKNPPDLKKSLQIISFDMGGTSTDVARFHESMEIIYEHSVGDAALNAPAVDIETVASGGGSICDFDGMSLTVGPESAGADPGPACYGRGGPLTITDVNLLSGRLHPANFHISIVSDAAEKKLDKLTDKINSSNADTMSREEILEGFLDIANERMAQAIRKISIQKGFDPSEYTLVAFGGAGAQHALAVAGKLNIQNVLVPADAGLLSAYGLQQAKLEEISSQQILQPLSKIPGRFAGLFEKLEEAAVTGLQNQGVSKDRITVTKRLLFMRFEGQDSSLELDWTPSLNPKQAFKQRYTDQYGHWIENREIEVEAIRVRASELKQNNPEEYSMNVPPSHQNPENGTTGSVPSRITQHGRDSLFQNIYLSSDVETGTQLTGPALILNPYSTTVIEPGWTGTLLEDGTWVMNQTESHSETEGKAEPSSEDISEAVNLQLYTNRFRSVADQMGEMLRKTSMSVNVKERLDFSCALLDRDGYLVVNAPHIPVHLGAMGSCVRAVMQWLGEDPADSAAQKRQNIIDSRPLVKKNPPDRDLSEDDVIITNHPAFGGSHLPDVTVITPVFSGQERIGFVASRAHHAEIGGKRPGSMPPDANNLAEEGVVIPPLFLAKKGVFDWETVTKLLKNGAWPSRSPDENLADLRAAVAANHRGVIELKKLVTMHGKEQVTNYMKKLKEYASGRMRSTLQKIPDGTYSAEEKMDDGSLLKVTCRVEGEEMSVDFTGTSGVHPGNLNANPSIVHSVVIYVLRLMVNEPLPLNDGLLDTVELIIPEGMLNPVFSDDPIECPAVVGGNIETSQRLTDTLLKAFGLAACSYGTMNNVLFGNETFGYYETVGGGTGAGDGFDGADAVHQHMTNTRATDPEILEHRYPVRLDRYAIRKNSGGKGRWSGGDGIIRELTFTEPVSLSVLSQHRVVKPYGLQNGEPGETGFQRVIKSSSEVKDLKWRDGEDLEAGDRFILHTPGGGGYSGKSGS